MKATKELRKQKPTRVAEAPEREWTTRKSIELMKQHLKKGPLPEEPTEELRMRFPLKEELKTAPEESKSRWRVGQSIEGGQEGEKQKALASQRRPTRRFVDDEKLEASRSRKEWTRSSRWR